MKQEKTLLGALAAAVLLLGGLVLWLVRRPEPAPETAAVPVLAGQVSRVSRIEVLHPEERYTLTAGEDGTFAVEELGEIPADPTAVQALAERCAVLTAAQLVEEQAEDPGKFGMTAPRAAVHITGDGEDRTLLVGDPAPAGLGDYLMVQETGTVYLLDPGMADPFLEELTGLAGRELGERVPAGELTSIRISSGEPRQDILLTVSTEGEQADYYIEEPLDRPADSKKAGDLAMETMGLTASAAELLHPTPEQLSAVGLDDPAASITMTWGEGESLTLLAGEDRGGQVFLMKEGVPVLYRAERDRLPWLTVLPEDLMERTLPLPGEELLSSLTVTAGEVSRSFSFEDREGEWTVLCDGARLAPEAFRTLYRELTLPEGEGPETRTPAGEPVLTVAWEAMGEEHLAAFFPEGEELLLTVDGAPWLSFPRGIEEDAAEALNTVSEAAGLR